MTLELEWSGWKNKKEPMAGWCRHRKSNRSIRSSVNQVTGGGSAPQWQGTAPSNKKQLEQQKQPATTATPANVSVTVDI
jgi:hypothetical protein